MWTWGKSKTYLFEPCAPTGLGHQDMLVQHVCCSVLQCIAVCSSELCVLQCVLRCVNSVFVRTGKCGTRQYTDFIIMCFVALYHSRLAKMHRAGLFPQKSHEVQGSFAENNL